MNPIPGVELKTLVETATHEQTEALTAGVKRKIAAILGHRRTERQSIAALETQVVKAKERIVKLEEKLRRIEAGEWSVLEEELPKVQVVVSGAKPSQESELETGSA